VGLGGCRVKSDLASRSECGLNETRARGPKRRGVFARARGRGISAVLVTILMCATAISIAPPSAVAAGPCGPPIVNPVACENTKPGTPQSDWFPDDTDDSIAGFPTQFSVNVGQTESFKIMTDAHNYTLDIYRLGYYGGDGARKVASISPSAPLPQNQPACLTDATGLVDCGNWGVSASWTVPSDAVSGVYLVDMTRTDTGGDNYMLFVVRNDASHSDILYQTSDTTWQAYNRYGGNSLYFGSANTSTGRAYKVSYNRPLGDGVGDNSPFDAEYPMIRFMEANGYDVSYVGGADVDRSGSLLLNHKVFMSSGHDEYWSGQQRANVEAARNAGVNLAFFSGNEIFWKTRWETSIDGSGTTYRTLVCYKETLDDKLLDPTGTWTGTWMDPRFSPPEDGGRPQNALSGTLFTVSGPRDDAIQVPASDGKLRFWRNTSIANSTGSQVTTLPEGTLGYEWDSDVDNGFRPAGLIDMSHTTVNIPDGSGPYVNLDYGATFGGGTPTHSVTEYRASSGALVFSAGTIQWSWGLDDNHLTIDGQGSVDPDMQQATINVFADMGVQPATLQSGLVAATASADHTPPTATITSPAPNATVKNGTPVTISGTASDTGGGIVAGVEVSTDGGATWHPAQGRTSWTYSWTPTTSGPVTIEVRATDDSANIQTTPTSESVNTTWVCPCNIFPSTEVPAGQSTDTTPLEMGVRFQTSVNGMVSGIRFYKGPGNTGTHTGSLWNSSGQLLATATFTNETASGWQQVLFPQPVMVSPGTTYIASYFAPNGSYSFTNGEFAASSVGVAPLTALKDGTDGPNGVYRVGSSGFPGDTYGSSNYYVDVVFSDQVPPDTTPPTIQGRTPAPNANGISVTDPVVVTFSEAMNPSSVSVTLKDASNQTVPATLSYSVPLSTATLTPSSPLASGATYTASVTGTDLAGNALSGSPVTWTFTTGGAGTCPCHIFSSSASPATTSANDSTTLELGVKFRSDSAGYVYGIRFYKGAGNTGTHTGSLWNTAGQQLATATFNNETATGWQDVQFSQPVAIAANTTYVASYFSPNGHYAYTSNQFGLGAVDNPPLHGLASGTDGSNGVYKANAAGYPGDSFGNTNYWVDVDFGTQGPADTTPPTIVASSPSSGGTGSSVADPVVVTFSEAMNQSSLAITLKDASNQTVPSTLSYSASTNTATLTPNNPLTSGGTYSVSVSGSDLAGNALTGAPVTWSFTAGGAGTCPCHVFSSSATPQGAAANDPTSLELGMKFRSDSAGYIYGIRFYKGPGNTGTHTGSLWNTAGQQLATATFTNESDSGWQDVQFSSPVAIAANTTYIASYFAPNGHEAYSSNQFGLGAVDNPPLHGLASGTDGANGVYKANAPGFPGDSFNNTNYWVDVDFSTQAPPDLTAPTMTSASPVSGSTSVSVTDPVVVTFSEAMNQSSLAITLKDASNQTVPATLSYNASTNTATLTPNNPLTSGATYNVSVAGSDLAGNALTGAPITWSYVTGGTGTCPCSIFSSSATPQNTSTNDSTTLELGVKFQTDVAGQVTGIRFYKGAGNTGTHVGNLWNTAGQLLASATFTNETNSGWQQVLFSQPVTVTADTTYVASYFAPNGHYASTPNQFGLGAVDNAPLHALASGVQGSNGVYNAGASAYPQDSFGNANYWVDVVFNPLVTLTAANGNAVAFPLSTNSTVTSVGGACGIAGDSPTVNVSVTGASTETGTATCNGGTWTYNLTTPFSAAGTYNVTATQVDAAGNTGVTGAKPVIVDQTAPVVALSQVNGSTQSFPYLTNAVTTVGGTCGTSSGDSATVNVSIAGTSTQTGTATCAGGSWAYSPGPTLSDGSYQVTASQSDAAGNTGTSTTQTVNVDGTAPVVTLLSANSTNGTFPLSTNTSVTTVGGACGTAAGDSATVNVSVTGASNENGTAACNAGSWAYTMTNPFAAAGTYNVTATQTDAATNSGSSGAKSVIVDLTAPAVGLTQVNGTARTFPYLTNASVTTVGGTCGTAAGDSTTINVAVTGAGTQAGAANCSGGTWTFAASPSLSTSGTYSITATQLDAATNVGTSGAQSVTLDTTAPVVTLTTVNGNAATFPLSTNATATTVGGACGTASGDSATVTVAVTGASTQSGTATCNSGAWTRTFATSLSANGTYNVTATQTDTAGNTGSSGTKAITVDKTAPAVTLTQVNGSARTFPLSINATVTTIGGACGTASGDTSSVAVTVTGASTQNGIATCSGASWTFTLASSLSASGAYNVSATQTDTAGNTGSTGSKAITVDKTAPTIALTQANGSARTFPWTTNATVTSVGGTCGTASGDTNSVTVTVTGAGTQTGTAPCQGNGSWTRNFSTSLSNSGTYTVTATQTDAAGNTGTSAQTIIVDKTVPVVTLTSVNGATHTFPYTTSSTVTTVGGACGTASGDSTTVTVAVTGSSTQSGTATCTGGAWTRTLTTPLTASGTYNITATQTDSAGNSGSSGSKSIIHL